MKEMISVLGAGFFTGLIGLICGGATLGRKLRRNNKIESRSGVLRLPEFCAGLLAAVICFDLLPEAFLIDGLLNSILGIILGVFLMLIFQNLLASMRIKHSASSFWMEAALFCIPGGLALGTAFFADGRIAGVLALAILIYSITFGIRYSRNAEDKGQLAGAAAAYSILIGLGALSGGMMARGSGSGTALLFSMSGGALLYLCAGDLIREPDGSGRIPAVLNILGILAGLLLSVCS